MQLEGIEDGEPLLLQGAPPAKALEQIPRDGMRVGQAVLKPPKLLATKKSLMSRLMQNMSPAPERDSQGADMLAEDGSGHAARMTAEATGLAGKLRPDPMTLHVDHWLPCACLTPFASISSSSLRPLCRSAVFVGLIWGKIGHDASAQAQCKLRTQHNATPPGSQAARHEPPKLLTRKPASCAWSPTINILLLIDWRTGLACSEICCK